MIDPGDMQQLFDNGEQFRANGQPAEAIAAYTEILDMDPVDPETLHMRGVAFGMRIVAKDRRALAQAGFSGDFSSFMLEDLLAARERYTFDDKPAGLAHVARDIGKAYYLRGEYPEARNELGLSIRQFEALDRPAEVAMSRSFLGRVGLLEWSHHPASSSSHIGATMLTVAEMDLSMADEALLSEGAEQYELYGKTPHALALAILGRKDEARAQLQRARLLNEWHGNATLAIGIRTVSLINELQPILPEFIERRAVDQLLAH